MLQVNRCCAVNGGTTVLRCRVKSAVLRRHESGPSATSERVRQPDDVSSCSIGTGVREAEEKTEQDEQQRVAGDWRVEGVMTEAGQTLKCGHLIAGSAVMQ